VTPAEDPVRAYLHDIGKVRLLSAAPEVEIGRRIEVGQAQLWEALAGIPLAVHALGEAGDKLRRGAIPPDAVIDPFAEFPLRSALLQWLGIEATGFLRATGLRQGGYVEKILAEWKGGGGGRLDSSLGELAAACTAAGARLTVAVYPFMVKPSRNPLAPIEADALARCARLGIDAVALVDAFEKDEDLTRYWITPLDAHPDARAHAQAARLLAERFTK